MKLKSDAREFLHNFIMCVRNQFTKGIKVIRTDNAKEFCWKDFYDLNGILHQRSCNETPQQNSIVERKHQHILNITCLMFQSNLPKVFWSYAVLHSVHLINCLPSPVIQNKCPYELMYECMPGISDTRILGCVCFASTLEQNRHKLDPRARKCIFLGFKQGTKGCVVLDVNFREIFVSRNVVFYETFFYNISDKGEQETVHENSDFTRQIYDDLPVQK